MQNMVPETIRPIIFITALIMFYSLQKIIPVFNNQIKKRSFINWSLFLSSILTLRLILPMGIVGVLSWMQSHQYFAFALFKLNPAIEFFITIFIFDFLIYWQHRIFHIFNPLWRLHRIHHCDPEMDVSSGFRFHPIEIVLSAFYKIFFLFLLSPRIETFIIYEIILNTMAMFNHSNFKIAPDLDKWLRYFIVTPAMHYPHHDTSNKLMNMNYGNFLSLWDRIFKSYTDENVKRFGVQNISEPESIDFKKLILLHE